MRITKENVQHSPEQICSPWSQVDYVFNSEQERAAAIANGSFDIGHIQTVDAQYYYSSSKPNIQKAVVFEILRKY
ncbi:hypothetical protein GWI33_007800 [Rhynchophorus ferrugineus]|uniref:Uncharacterized protein n=1 Tax=Rhynchophorus ferrugineus TaxID=354439 RepID=A0A834IF04_RHYFE|nr:hypothetical protein GWI33_007800 [Rhynchophorus ferrugineus]